MEMLDFRTGELVEVGELVVQDSNGEMAIAKKACELIEAAELTKKAVEEAYRTYKTALREAMEEFGIDMIKTESFTASYKEGYWRSGGIDSDKLKKRFPEAYEACKKEGSFVGPTAAVRMKKK